MTKIRVLLGDDHALILDGVRATLQLHYEVVGQVTDGKALVAAAERLKPDLIVLDISMPLLNGFESARRIKELLPSTKLIFLSQHLQPAAMYRVLGPPVAGPRAARLGPDLQPEARVEAVLASANTDAFQLRLQPELEQLPHRVWLQVDANAERAELPDRLDHLNRYPEFVEGEGERQPGDACSGDDNGHGLL